MKSLPLTLLKKYNNIIQLTDKEDISTANYIAYSATSIADG